ncbi:transglycosylase SLT domain-containing protein [Pseudochelatococcus sp. B33]
MRLGTGLLLSLAVITIILAPGLLGGGRDADDAAVHTSSITPTPPAGAPASIPASAPENAPASAADSASPAQPASPPAEAKSPQTAALPDTPPPAEPIEVRWPEPDVAAFREALALYRAGKVDEGDAAAARIADAATRDTLEWIAIRSSGAGIDLTRLAAFARRNPDWPGSEALRRRIEAQYLQGRPSAADVFDTFAAREPVTVAGRMALSRALADAGQAERGLGMARDLWRTEALSASARRSLLDTHGASLTTADHRARLRNMLYGERWEAAQDTALRLGRDEPALVDAFVAVAKRTHDAKKLINAVPDALRTTPEYLLARSRFERRDGDLKAAAAALVKAAEPNKAAIAAQRPEPQAENAEAEEAAAEADNDVAEAQKAASEDAAAVDGGGATPTPDAAGPQIKVIAAPIPPAAGADAAADKQAAGSQAAGSQAVGSHWALEQRLVARALLDAGNPKAAYEVAALPFAASDADRIDAAFFAGWIALRFLDDADAAAVHFAEAAPHATLPISVARVAYWRGRAAQAQKDDEAAQAFFSRAAEHSTTYYGQLARARLGLADVAVRPLPEPSVIARRDLAQMKIAQAVRLLIKAGETDLTLPFLSAMAARLDEDHLVALAELIEEARDARATLIVGKAAAHRGKPFDVPAFPTFGIPEIDDSAVEGPMIYAVTRQESAFDGKAVSHAGARGLMQLMPATAQATARAAGLPYDLTRLTSDPAYNARLGASHLGELVERWNGSYVLAIASYNAGPGNVRKWIAAYGDPRSPGIDAVDWVERIPFSETRNYVQRVLENLQVYRSRLNNETALLIEQDLQRGRRNAP